MNRLDEHTVNRIREMIRAGLSTRQIAARAGVNRGTAHTYLQMFKSEAPTCRHDKNLYACSTCCGSRRFASADRDIIWIKPGPKTKAPPPEIATTAMDEYGVLRTALIGVLRD